MGVWSFTRMCPSALLCASLVLLVFIFPETCNAGKNKVIPPVKQLFGVGIGYQKVVHYKPVLVFSKSRRVKHRRPGWGWSGGSGRGSGGGSHKPSYTPVVIKEHIHKHGKSGYPYGHSHLHQQHRRKRKRPQHQEHSHSSGRGWGWRQEWRRPHRSYRKGHGGGNTYHNLDKHLHHHHRGTGGGGSGESYEYPRNHDLHNNHEVSHYPSSEHLDDHGGVWGGVVVGGGSRGTVVYPSSHSSNYYGSPYSSMDDIEDDHGGYESEISEQWKKDVPISPIISADTTTVPPSSSQSPFTEHTPQNDASVTSIQKDFLRNHMKNFHQFQEYQQHSTRKEPKKDQEATYFAPFMLTPPGPHFSTTNSQSSEGGERGNIQYDEYADDDIRGNTGGENYDDDYDGVNNELYRKTMQLAQPSTQISTTITPNSASHAVQSRSDSQQIITAMPKNDKIFKPSPRVDESRFNKPGFFPTF